MIFISPVECFYKVLAILSKNHSQQLMSTIGEAIKAQAAHVKMINRKKNLSDYDELMASHCQVLLLTTNYYVEVLVAIAKY